MLHRLFHSSADATTVDAIATTTLRAFAGCSLAFAHGFGKLPPPERLVAGVAEMGFPAPTVFAWAAALAEGVGGVLLALGLLTRPATLAIVVTMAVAAFVAHAPDPYGRKELALLYLMVALFFHLRGAGSWSLDHAIARGLDRRMPPGQRTTVKDLS